MNFESMCMTINKVKHASLQHATAFGLCSDGMLSVPRSLILNGIVSYGGSTGAGLNLIAKAFGEYYERNHFFTAVPIDSIKFLSEIRPLAHQKKLMTLCNNSNNSKLGQHKFSFTKVYNIFDDTMHDYFFNAISLHGIKEDASFLGLIDSCGCASYPNKELSLYHAMMEFLERQSLIGSWISKTYRYAINSTLLLDISPYTCLIEKLLENGDIYIFENGNYLPGYNIIMFYFAQSSCDAVQYAVGAKSGISMIDALNGALAELYQCYTFLYSAAFKPTNLEHKAGSGYHQAFTYCNRRDTKSKIPFFDQSLDFKINTLADIQQMPKISYADILLKINQITSSVYYYHFYEKSLQLHFTKIFSPDFFAHMSLDKSFNINNLYANSLNISSENAYLEPLPFP